MNIRKQINKSVSYKITTGFAFIIFLAVVFSLISLFTLNSVKSELNEVINTSVQIEGITSQIRVDLFEIQQVKDQFLLEYHTIGITQTKTKALSKLDNLIESIQENADSGVTLLAQTNTEPESIAPFQQISNLTINYQSNFKNLIALIEKQGSLSTGVEGQAHQKIREMETLIDTLVKFEQIRLKLHLLTIEHQEPPLFINEDVHVFLISQAVTDFKQEVTITSIEALSNADKTRLHTAADEYLALIKQSAQIQMEIQANLNQLNENIRDIREASALIRTNSQENLTRTVDDTNQIIGPVNIINVLGLLAIAVMGLFIAAFLARNISRPVERLTELAINIMNGDLSQQVEVLSDDELGILAKAFNSMTTRLRELVDTLEQQVSYRTYQYQSTLAETEKLYHISHRMIASNNLTELIAAVVEEIDTPVINRAILLTFDYNASKEIESIVVLANWYSGQGTPPSFPGTRYQREALSSMPLLLSTDPIFFENVQYDDRVDPATLVFLKTLNIHALAILPLRRQQHQVGVLLLEGEMPHPFSRREKQLYLSLLGQLTTAVENQQLFEQTQQRALELNKAKEAAEMANKAKSEFLANMSHELRTPLNGILGYTQILKLDENLSQQQADGLDIIHQSGQHLLTLINDILDLSKVEAGRMKLHPTNFHLPNFLSGIANISRTRAKVKNITFNYQPLSTLPTGIRADETRLRQILLNLLDNAIKFTDKGGVVLRCSVVKAVPQLLSFPPNDIEQGETQLKPDEVDRTAEIEPIQDKTEHPNGKDHSTKVVVRFEVIDTGAGLTEEQQNKIFLPFEQVGDIQRRAEGTGLGLAISQRLVQMMGSQLKIKSKKGEGSTFWIDLEFPLVSDFAEQRQSSVKGIKGYKGPRYKVLIIDDKKYNRSIIVNLLEPLGFETFEAENGQEGVVKAQVIHPDVIFMDLVMPVMMGFEASQKIREVPDLQNVIIVANSASVFDEDRQQSILAGCNAFLNKPVQTDKLFGLLEKHLDLEWIYDGPNTNHLTTQDSATQTESMAIIPPPPDKVSILFDLAMRGDMRELQAQAADLEKLDAKFVPFSRKLGQLAKQFQDREIVALIEEFMD